MTKAKVELLESASHTGIGRRLFRGQPQIITNPSEIAYYRNQSGIRVTMLDEVVAPKAITEKKIIVTDELKVETKEEVKEENFDSDNSSEVENKSKYTVDNLKGLKKEGLIEIASELGVFLDGSEKKKDMITEILEAQQD